jgi:ParB family chromosome partitioning protein
MANKLKDRLMARTANLADKVEAAAIDRPSINEQKPMTMPGQLGAFRLEAQRYQHKIDELQTALAEARKAGGSPNGIEIPLDRLVEVEGRRRFLSDEQKIELRENLRHNKLVHPISVRPLPDGRFEIISGHNRVDQYKELGRDRIRAVLEDATDDEAVAGAFYANLMQSDLAEYEKYLGFKSVLERFPEMTQAKLSEVSGISETRISTLMAFEKLPSDAITIVRKRPDLLGSDAARLLAIIANSGHADRVIEAVQMLAEGKLKDQKQAVKYASSAPTEKTTPTLDKFSIKSGKAMWCSGRRVKNVMRLEFKTEEEAERMLAAVQAFLEAQNKAVTVDVGDAKK